jgi:hypothetical protein
VREPLVVAIAKRVVGPDVFVLANVSARQDFCAHSPKSTRRR